MEERRRHVILWKTARPITMAVGKLLFNYSAPVCREKGPFLVMSNHNADLDPVFVAFSFREPLYFVASEHIMRQGIVSDFLRWSTNIITRQKGGSAASTVRGIVRELQSGNDVCLFPEGNRSWDGVTRELTPATGKLAKMAGAKLITYRTEGLYFSNPRWAGGSIRRGKSKGSIVGVYEPEYLKSLSAKEVQEIIQRDLYENAYERQRTEHTKFQGRNLAEHLETLLFICPHCKSMHHLVSSGDYFTCTECGTKLRYTPEGFFEGENMIFDTVLDWKIWQKEKIRELCKLPDEEPVVPVPIFNDSEMDLYSVSTAQKAEYVATGNLVLYHDRLILPGGASLPVGKITGMALRGAQDLYLSSGGKNYIVKSKKVRCTSKYLTACSEFNPSLRYGI